MIEGLQLGTLDMCLAATSQLTSFVPEYQVFDLPYIFTSRQQAWDTLDGELGVEMLDMLQSKGLVGLSYFEVGFRNFTNNKGPIETPDDIAGKKFRTMETPVHVAAIGYWGGNHRRSLYRSADRHDRRPGEPPVHHSEPEAL